MKELVEELVHLIVMEPEEVEVEEKQDRNGTVYEVSVAQNDVGRLIGKDGRVITSVRHVVGAAASKAKQRASVKVLTD